MGKNRIRERVAALRLEHDKLMKIYHRFQEVRGLCNMKMMRQLAQWAKQVAADLMKEMESLLQPPVCLPKDR